MAGIGHQGGGVGDEAVGKFNRHEHRVEADRQRERAPVAIRINLVMVVAVTMAMAMIMRVLALRLRCVLVRLLVRRVVAVAVVFAHTVIFGAVQG